MDGNVLLLLHSDEPKRIVSPAMFGEITETHRVSLRKIKKNLSATSFYVGVKRHVLHLCTHFLHDAVESNFPNFKQTWS
jgi:hypothetical protein